MLKDLLNNKLKSSVISQQHLESTELQMRYLLMRADLHISFEELSFNQHLQQKTSDGIKREVTSTWYSIEPQSSPGWKGLQMTWSKESMGRGVQRLSSMLSIQHPLQAHSLLTSSDGSSATCGVVPLIDLTVKNFFLTLTNLSCCPCPPSVAPCAVQREAVSSSQLPFKYWHAGMKSS